MAKQDANGKSQLHPWTRDLADRIASAQLEIPPGNITIQHELAQHATQLTIHRCNGTDLPNRKGKSLRKQLLNLAYRQDKYAIYDQESQKLAAQLTARTNQTSDLAATLATCLPIFAITLLLAIQFDLGNPTLTAAIPTALAAAACQVFQYHRHRNNLPHLLAANEVLEAIKTLATQNVPPTQPTYTIFKDQRNYLVYLETRPKPNQNNPEH